ncbi:hypothetical protein ABMA28_001793 [Loxostege sticticalis]|uniref:Uncharacterized protein n=1 Tax=Loxostege sticticalis TaxID=481309 RepID=A0ABD0T4F6_LOXSC
MTIDLYYTLGSPPCRLVDLVGAALGVKFNRKHVNLLLGEHLTPEFLKINPQHTLPTIVDDGYSLWDSRAISRYLIYKYGKDSNLYPEDAKARATIDQRVDFDLGTLYTRFEDYFYPQIFAEAPADEAKYKKLEEALKFLDNFLEGQKYAAGPELTLADLVLVISVSSIEAAGIPIIAYPNVVRWFKLVKGKYGHVITPGAAILRNATTQLLKK